MVDVSRNSEVISNIIAALEFEYCGNTYNHHNIHHDKDTAWYDYIDINSINIPTHYEPLPATEEILNDTKVIIIPDDQTQKRDNTSSVNKLNDPHQYQMYNLPRAQMDGGTKSTVTNNLHLLKDVKWYNQWFRPKMTMKGAPSDNIIMPEAQGLLQVSTITEGVTIDVLCYYSPEFTSTLLSDNDVILSNKNSEDFAGQSMLKFFDPKELDEMEEFPIPKL